MNTYSLESYMSEIRKHNDSRKAYSNGKDLDLNRIASDVSQAVTDLLTETNACNISGASSEYYRPANISFEAFTNACGADKLDQLMDRCHVPEPFREACMEQVALALNRTFKGTQGAWAAQLQTADHSSNQNTVRSLNTIYPSEVIDSFANAVPGTEAFGANIDMVIPDLKVTLTTAIMNFHARIMPRLLPCRTTDQPNATYTKEYLEIYDNSKQDGPSMRLIDLYADPSFARNELQKIIPLKARDTEGNYLLKDGILLFGPQANILKLSLDDTKPGYDKINRTDIIEENVKLEYVYVSLTGKNSDDELITEVFQIPTPDSFNRLSRAYNSHDSADRQGDFTFDYKLYSNSLIATNDVEGTWKSATTELLKGLDEDEFIRLRIIVKPSLNLKRGIADCQGSFTVSAGHAIDDSQVSAATATLAESLNSAAGHSLVGYSLDARFSEANLRKTNIAMMTHRVPFAYDIPVGRNYVFDYAIGQVNAEENAANLTKIIGIGQDDVQLKAVIKTIESTYDRIQNFTVNPADPYDHVGADFVAGDKIRPTIFLGALDFSKLNIIRDADRSGDIKQKAKSYLNGVTARIMQLSFLQQQLGGSTTATFKVVTSMEVLANVFSQQHIHNHMVKDDMRDLGDGIEYVLVLDNGVRLEFVTSTFNYMRNKLIMVPVIPGNAECELNFGTIWSNGQMVAHYTPSADAAWHRLFANIRELMVVTCPIGAIIDISGLEIISGIATSGVLRPTIQTIATSGEATSPYETPYGG